jgi:predicted ATPase/transcriptional regulator with XRE-family HTH domain
MNNTGADTPVSFNDWVQQRRRFLDMTRSDLSQAVGCSVSALRKIESGERRPSKQLAHLLATFLKVPSEYQSTFIRTARGDINIERLPMPGELSDNGSGPEPENNLANFRVPHQHTPLVGRESELAALSRLLRDGQCRLLTITGLGGIGKTRLAMELASLSRVNFPGGIYFISLASLHSAEFIPSAIGEAMKLSFSGSSNPRHQLLHHLASLKDKSVLLILDNLEHLLSPEVDDSEACLPASLFVDILDSSPSIKILVTSRQRIHIQDEWTFELHGLPVPQEHNQQDLRENSATALFLESAKRVAPEFTQTAEDQVMIIRICQLVGGIPLAIELAAAWTEVLSCEEIAFEIQTNLEFLTSKMRDIPERHRSLRAAFDHSWRLLSEEERGVLCRLAVFQGGFRRQAADQIVGADLNILANLVAKSLVRRIEGGRYDLHEVIRQFALFHLDTGISENIRTSHCQYYLDLLSTKESQIKGAGQREAIQELVNDLDNLRAAWSWAVSQQIYPSIGKALRCFGWFCSLYGLLDEGIEKFETAIQSLTSAYKAEEHNIILGELLSHQGFLYFRKGLFDNALACLKKSITCFQPPDNPRQSAFPLLITGIILFLNGDIKVSQSYLQDALEYSSKVGDEWVKAYSSFNLGYTYSLLGQYSEGYNTMLTGLDMFRDVGDPSQIALGLNYLGLTAVRMGRHAEARSFLEKSLELTTQVGDRWGMGTSYRHLGAAAMAQGKIEEAKYYLNKSLDTFNGYIIGWDIVKLLIYLAEAERASGNISEARQTLKRAIEMGNEVGAPQLTTEAMTALAQLDPLGEGLTNEISADS